MHRRRLPVFSLSLLLLGATLWTRSYWIRDAVMLYEVGGGWSDEIVFGFSTDHGQFELQWSGTAQPFRRVPWPVESPPASPVRHPWLTCYSESSWRSYPYPDGRNWLAFWRWRYKSEGQCVFPLAVFCALGLIVPIRRFVLLRRRRKGGLCIRCAYDLRASHGICPECGQPVEKERHHAPAAHR